MIKARGFLTRGCTTFLAYVIDANKEKKEMSVIPVVCNFMEVVPDDILGLPPEKQVDFIIDILPYMTLIAKAPYHLEPTEMNDLMTQLHELLVKGFIRPSSSPFTMESSGTICEEERQCDKICVDY